MINGNRCSPLSTGGDITMSDSSFSDSSGGGATGDDIETTKWMRELQRKRSHPEKLDDNLWFNEVGQV